MAGEWSEMTLGDVIELKRGYDLPSRDRRDGPFPIVSSSGISGHHTEAKAKAPGVVIGRYGTLGEVHYITEDYWPLNTALYVRDFKGNDPRFVSYFLRSLDFTAYSDKAAVPGLNRNDLHTAQISLPALSEQRAIAHILGTLDDKIELNRRMSATLEAMARALFKSWFVDFDPVRAKAEGRDPGLPQPLADLFPDSFEDSQLGEIPRGWEVKALDEIARFVNGLALQKYPPTGERSLPVIKIAQLRAGNTEGADRASVDLEPAYIVQDGDILFSWSGSLECVLWSAGLGALNQHLFKVTSDQYPKWLCYLGVHHHLADFRHIAAGKATTMGHIQRHHLSDAKLGIPSPALLSAMDVVFAHFIESTWRRAVEARTLASLRDALLPKLISGELRVDSAESFIGRAV
jgi:type I restriction enzyme S subunit